MRALSESTVLPNEVSTPSQVDLTKRPPCRPKEGITRSVRCVLRSAWVPLSFRPINREYPTTSIATIAASLRCSWATSVSSVAHHNHMKTVQVGQWHPPLTLTADPL